MTTRFAAWNVCLLVLAFGCDRSPSTPAKLSAAAPLAAKPALPQIEPAAAETLVPSEPSVDEPAETVVSNERAEQDAKEGDAPKVEEPAAQVSGPQPAGTDDGTERLVLFLPGGPLVVEMRMTIDGRPFGAVREELIDELLRVADGDHDGKPTWAEVYADPKRIFGGRTDLGIEMKNRREFLKAHDTNSNGLVDRDEARRFIAQVNRAGAAFALDGSTEYRGLNQRESPVRRLLDADGDEVLSAAELADASERFLSRDANDDDIVEFDELREAAPADSMSMNSSATANLGPPAAARLGPNANWDAVRYAFSEWYLDQGRLRDDGFSLTPALAGQLDLDGDGWLAREELERLDALPPHLVLEVNFGRAGDLPPGITLRTVAPELIESAGLAGADEVVERTALGLVLELPGVLLRFEWRDRPPGDEQRPSADEQLAALDADKNGYLEKSEVEGAETAAAAPFDDWDADGDGKVYSSEIAAYDRRRQAPQLSAVRATANDDQDVIFPLLDVDQDGRLTARELAQVAERLKGFDRNGDGSLAFDELPGSIGIVIDRGGGSDQMMRNMPAPVAAATSATGPPWFLSMDTNHDLLVTPREFPGSRAKFAAVDANGDGFIDLAEAEAAGSSGESRQ
ncbi:MAG TPA: hypothetical protein VGX78_03910 [Pirellulales bacterium]|nr:hypothetical protein [Pirellulales bacterium]